MSTTKLLVRCNASNQHDRGNRPARAVQFVHTDLKSVPLEADVDNVSMSATFLQDRAVGEFPEYGDICEIEIRVVTKAADVKQATQEAAPIQAEGSEFPSQQRASS